MSGLRFSREEVAAVYNTPLLDLVYTAASVHRMYNDPQMVSNAAANLDPTFHNCRQKLIWPMVCRFSAALCSVSKLEDVLKPAITVLKAVPGAKMLA